MALPNITSYILGTRQPMDYTSSALDAYLAVSQEMRARHQQMMSDLKQGQQQMESGQENIRRGEAHEQDMIDAQVNRSIRLEDQAFAREEMGWRREMHPLQMERARLGLEAERFDQTVAQPLRLEMDRLQLRRGQFELQSAAAEAAMMGQKQSAFQSDLGILQKISAGEVPSPEPSVVEGRFGNLPGGFGGLSGMKVEGIKPGQLYWNHDMGAPMAVVDGDDGSPVAIAPPGQYSFESGKPQRFTPIRPITGSQLPAPDRLQEFFSGVKNPGSPEALTAMDRARDANGYLGYLETAYADTPAAKGVLGGFRAMLERDPGYQLAKTTGHLESPLERSQRIAARENQLRWAFPGDEEFRDWTSRNPELLDSFRNLPDDQVEPTLKRIEAQRKEAAKGGAPQVSASLASDLRKAEIALIQARSRLDSARGNDLQKHNLSTFEAELKAAEEAAAYLRGQAGMTGGVASPVDAAEAYFTAPP
jgi:hypothetical protein